MIPLLVDDRNRTVWELVSGKYEVKFEPAANHEYSVYTIGEQITFYIPENDHCPDSFTHELLHTLVYYYGCPIGGGFKNRIAGSQVLQRIFDIRLCEHITNSIEHRLMLPLYLEMGFEPSKFLCDYELFKSDQGLLAQVKRLYKTGNTYNITAVRNVIGKYFTFRCDPNPDFDYTAELKYLKTIDPLLVAVMDSYLHLWDTYDFKTDELGEYRENHTIFYEGLKKWMTGKNFAREA